MTTKDVIALLGDKEGEMTKVHTGTSFLFTGTRDNTYECTPAVKILAMPMLLASASSSWPLYLQLICK